MANYTITHLHSDFSSGTTNIDSITKYTDYIDRAKECGMKAITFTEHGNVFSWLHKKEYCEKQGLKYIHGIEAYITKSLDEKIRDNYHCVLIAKNYEGVKEINRLSSSSFNRQDGHFYYMPRITFDELIDTSENVIICTACLGSILGKTEDDSLREQFITFLMTNKDRCFLEIQHHNVEDQIKYNRYLYELHNTIGVPMVTGTDTHALNEQHLKGRSILQRAKGVHFAEEESWDLAFKTYDELVAAYQKQKSLPMEAVYEAIENTNKIADMVEEFEIDRSYKYPHLWDNPLELFKQKIQEGIKKRGVDKFDNYQEYLDRIDHEMEAYIHNGAIDFMLLMDDILTWCRANDIEVGYGRGSVNGSVVAWLLEITEMDSIKHNLNFDRFMNIERVSLSDIDTDFPPSRINDVKNYIFNRHGLHCSDIITFNTIADKGAIRDVGRALNIPLAEVGAICDSVDNEEAYKKMRKKYKELFEYVDLVKGTIVSVGSHPCGTIVCEYELEETVGLFTTSTSDYPISQLNMKEIDSMNYVKLDLLKLDSAELINETCKLAGIPRLTPDNVDINDIEVWNAIRDDTTQIFQWEGTTGDSYIKKLLSDENIKKFKAVNENIDRMTLLSIGNSAIRPAGASYREDLANGVVRKTGSKPIDDFLSNTFGYLVFQCQIIEFLHEYCGFTMGEADIVRRCLDENTEITMATGELKKIKDVKIGNYVQCFKDGFSKSSKVTNVFDNGVQDVIEIITNNGYSLVGTKQHKVLTQNGWKTIGELTCNDYLMTPTRINSVGDGLRPNQRLDSTDLMMIGLLLGDGRMSGNAEEISFVNSDTELIETYKKCVLHRIKHGDPNNCEFHVYEIDGKSVDKIYTVKVKTKSYKKSLHSFLCKLGINKKSADKFIPNEIMRYPVGKKLCSLLGGLFSSDGGHIEGSNAIEYSSISKQLACDIKQLLLKYGIYSYVYSSYVKRYDYYCYKVRISQKNSLLQFAEEILPYMVGHKKHKFAEIVSKNETANAYNYLLPNEYTKEIRAAFSDSGTSFNSICIDVRNDTLTDIKAMNLITKVYCPNTYKMLMSQYEPMKIKHIAYRGRSHVYDLEVEGNHNYVANGVIVHNCFAKKLGTEQWLPIIKNGGYSLNGSGHYIAGFIKTMKDKYGIDEKKSEEDIVAFIQVIEDASSYLFSLNHSAPYSYEGYVSGYLRTHYPLEFLTVALNINSDNQKKTAGLISYAKKVNIELKPPKFRYSQAGYFCDKSTNAIYKGIGSIKNLNDKVAEEMYELRNNSYSSFVDLLFDLKEKTSLNSRQRDILIKIDFFSEFGDINKMLEATRLFDEMYGKQSTSQTKAEEYGISHQTFKDAGCEYKPRRVDDINFISYANDHDIDIKSLKKFARKKRDGSFNGYSLKKFSETFKPSQEDLFKYATKVVDGKYSEYDLRKVLNLHIASLNIPECTLPDKMKYQLEFLGYIDYIDENLEEGNRYIVVTDLDTTYSPKFKAYCIGTGETIEMKVKKKLVKKDPAIKVSYAQVPFEEGDILYMQTCRKEPKRKKVDGEWTTVQNEFNWWLINYGQVKNLV